MSPALIVLVLSLLLGLQPITTDLYLPALPALRHELGAGMAQTQLTLTALLLAFGLSQLVWGPLSDRFGRRPVLLWGLAAYVLASVASTLAPTMALLVVARTVQGAAMGAGVMCARAIVRDLYGPVEGARVMSKGLTGLGLIACLSPPLGGLLSDWMGWRVALLALSVFGAVTLALVLLRFEETARHKNPKALQPRVLWQTWRAILKHPTFWSFSLLAAASYGGLFTFLASSSFIFIQTLGLSKAGYGLLVFSTSFTYLLGTVLCRRLLPRLGLRRTLALSTSGTLLGGSLLGLAGLNGLNSGWALMPPFYLFMLAHGINQPCSQSGAVGPFPQAAGTASALNGFFMMLAAFVTGNWLGTHMDGSVLPLTMGVWFWSGIVALAGWGLVQKYGEPHEH